MIPILPFVQKMIAPDEEGHRLIIIKKGLGPQDGSGPNPECLRRKALEAEREAIEQREREIDAELGGGDEDEELEDKKLLTSDKKVSFK